MRLTLRPRLLLMAAILAILLTAGGSYAVLRYRIAEGHLGTSVTPLTPWPVFLEGVAVDARTGEVHEGVSLDWGSLLADSALAFVPVAAATLLIFWSRVDTVKPHSGNRR